MERWYDKKKVRRGLKFKAFMGKQADEIYIRACTRK